MDKELLSKQKEIDSLINKRSNLTAVVIVIGGGTLSLLVMLDSIIKWILFFIGSIAFILFLKGLSNIEELIDRKIKELKK